MTALLLALLACSNPDPVRPKDDSDTGAPPDSHPTDTDSTAPDSDTGDSHDTQETAETGDSDTAPPPCDRSLGWSFVACGYLQTCGIHTNGCAECWGRGEEDGLPAWDTAGYNWYGEDQPPDGEYAEISMMKTTAWSGDTPNACGVLVDGTLACWGDDQFGVTDTPDGTYESTAVFEWGALALATDGTVVGWQYIVAPGGTYQAVEAVYPHVVLLTTSGTLVLSASDGSFVEGEVPGTFTDIGLGDSYGCAVRAEDGSLLCWDPNDPENAEYEPMTLGAPAGPFTDVCVMGGGRGCALDDSGTATCWQFDGDYEAPSDEVFKQIACGYIHSCGVTTDNRVVCWGYDYYGETIPPS